MHIHIQYQCHTHMLTEKKLLDTVFPQHPMYACQCAACEHSHETRHRMMMKPQDTTRATKHYVDHNTTSHEATKMRMQNTTQLHTSMFIELQLSLSALRVGHQRKSDGALHLQEKTWSAVLLYWKRLASKQTSAQSGSSIRWPSSNRALSNR